MPGDPRDFLISFDASQLDDAIRMTRDALADHDEAVVRDVLTDDLYQAQPASVLAELAASALVRLAQRREARDGR